MRESYFWLLCILIVSLLMGYSDYLDSETAEIEAETKLEIARLEYESEMQRVTISKLMIEKIQELKRDN